MRNLGFALVILTSVAGLASSARAQSCPNNSFSIGGLGFYEEFPNAPAWSGSGFAYNLIAGTLQGSHTGFGETGSYAQLTVSDRYVIAGPASGPIAFQARVHFTGSVSANQVTLPGPVAGCLGSTARMRLAMGTLFDEATVAAQTSPDCSARAIDETLELTLGQLPGEPFVLSASLSLSCGHSIGATASGAITFAGLPAGYVIQSCRGFTGLPVAARPLSWGRVKQIYR